MNNKLQIGFTAVITLSLSVSALSCGGVEALTPDQKKELKEFTHSASRVKGVGKSVSKNRRHEPGTPRERALPHQLGGAKVDVQAYSTLPLGAQIDGYADLDATEKFAEDPNAAAVYDVISRAFEDGKCGDRTQLSKSVSNPKTVNEFTITGLDKKGVEGNCPIELKWSFEKTEFEGKLNLDVKVSKDLAAKIGYDSVRVDGGGKGDEKSESAWGKLTFHHIEKGNITFVAELEKDEAKIREEYTISLPTFTAQIVAKSDKNGTELKLNGESITEAELGEYLAGLDQSFEGFASN